VGASAGAAAGAAVGAGALAVPPHALSSMASTTIRPGQRQIDVVRIMFLLLHTVVRYPGFRETLVWWNLRSSKVWVLTSFHAK
jgi:hypothetical protein